VVNGVAVVAAVDTLAQVAGAGTAILHQLRLLALVAVVVAVTLRDTAQGVAVWEFWGRELTVLPGITPQVLLAAPVLEVLAVYMAQVRGDQIAQVQPTMDL
jgi:hypothetical protein